MSLPISPKSFVIESADEPEPGWPGNFDDILPLFISLENVFRRLSDATLDIATAK